ncbi:MAG: gliding motility-associated C-terminal domain-containing protein [Bacteroidetes bacterium]|nr:gliding motility-associated C-terminal domain-containing protein [Bacteroidota bacterium]
MIKILRLSYFVIFLLAFAAIPLNSIAQIAVPQWVDDLGGPGGSSSIPAAVKVDKQNNIYVTGIFSGTVDFDPSAGVHNLTSNANSFDTYLAKYTSAGALIWVVAFGGTGTDQVNNMTIDDNGNPTVIGQYDSNSMDVDPGPGTTILTNNGDKDGFIVKFDTNGNFMWGRSIGGGGTDYGDRVAADHQGNVIVTVQYEQTVTVGGKNYTSAGSFNGLLIKYDPNGSVLWAINWSDTGDSEGRYQNVDASNNIYVIGAFGNNVNFNPLGTASYLNGNGSAIFLAKYSPSGILIWVQPIAGYGVNNNLNLCLDSSGNVYIDAPFQASVTFGGAKTLNPTGQEDIFLAKYTTNGVFVNAVDIGGAGAGMYNYGIVASSDNNVYISGYFKGTVDFDPSPTSAAPVSYHGNTDLFLAKYDSNLDYKWAFSAGNGSCGNTLGRNIDIDGNNDVILVGSFCSTVNFDASKCTNYNLTAQSDIRDSFIAKYVQAKPTPTSQITAFSVPGEIGSAVIDQTKLQITVTVPAGTDLTNLSPTITVSSGVTLSPASGTSQNFSAPVTYTLTTAACTSLNYSVKVVFANTAKPVTTCSGASLVLTGDAANPTPNSYLWQVLQNGVWVNAPGTNNAKNYQASALVNNTNANIVFSLRRQITTGTAVTDDSFYDVTVQPVVPVANNTIASPVTNTFCANGDPAALVGSGPAGGDGSNYAFQWQSSTNNVNFVDIAGATAKDYDPAAITVTTYYRRTVTSGSCTLPSLSNVVTMTVQPPLANNTVTAPAVTTFCASGTPGSLAGSTPAGGSGTYLYQWQSSTDNTAFTDIAGATGVNYDPGTITATTYYRRSVVSGACTTPLISNVVTITIQPPVSNNVIAAPAVATFCSVGDPSIITGSTPAGGNGAFSYQWQMSTDNNTFSNIPGAISQNYDPPSLNVTTYFRRVVTSTTCNANVSNVVTINIAPLPAAPPVTAPSVSVCPGNVATLSVSSPQQGISYNWYDSPSRSNKLFTGATYVTGAINAAQTFYVEAATTACTSPTLTGIQVNVIAVPGQPQVLSSGVTVCAGSTATLHVSGPQAGLTYAWYTSPMGGTSVFTGADFITPAIQSSTTYYVEAINNSGCPSLPPRTPVAVTVVPLPSAPVTSGTSICPGTSATLTANNSDPNIVINWYSSPAGGSILATGNTYTTPALSSNTTYYAEAVNTNDCSSANRSAANVTMIEQLAAPVVKVSATTITSVTFTWQAVPGASGYQVSTDDGVTFSDPSLGSSALTQTISNMQTGQTVTLIVRAVGSSPCQQSEGSLSVTGTAESQLGDQVFVPNAFTPNGDGKNDILYVYSSAIKSIKFYVYDQWGELIFTSLNQATGWDGTYKGAAEPVGVYVYYVEAIANDGQTLKKKGTVTLIR